MSSFASSAMTSRLSKATTNDVATQTAPENSVPPVTNATPTPEFRRQSELNMPLPLRRIFSRLFTSSLLIAGDITAYLVAYFLLLPFLSDGSESTVPERAFALAALTAIVLYASDALYPGYRLHNHEHLRRRTRASGKVATLTALGAILLPEQSGVMLAALGFLGLGLMVQPVTHWVARGLCWRLGIGENGRCS